MKEHQINLLLRIVNVIYSAGERGITREDLAETICGSTGRMSYPARTFANHKEAIRDIFGVNISCRAEGKGSSRRYYYHIKDCDGIVSGRRWPVSHLSAGNVYGSFPCHVILRVSQPLDRWLGDNPLHRSQHREDAEDGNVYMHYMLDISRELVSEIIRMGSGVEVVAPENLRDMVLENLSGIASVYGYRITVDE